MNTLKFEIREDDRVNVFMDGKNLIDTLKTYEKPFAKKEGALKIAGQYSGLHKENLLRNLKSVNGIKANILGCECGEEGCWPMQVIIKEDSNKIIWNNFEQPYRNKDSHNFWDYTDFGSFTFTKENYQSELSKLKL